MPPPRLPLRLPLRPTNTHLSAITCTLRAQQRRHARVHDVRFVTTQQRGPSAVLEKYRGKLEEKARAEGHTSINELKEAYAENIKDVRRKAAAPPPGATVGTSTDTTTAAAAASHSPLQQPPPPAPTPQAQPQTQSKGSPTHRLPESATGIKPLSSYLDLPKISTLPAKEIEYIWRLRLASDPQSLCAVIPLATYTRIVASAQKHPQFVLPLPRPAAEDGSGDIETSADGFAGKGVKRTAADVHFLQWGWHPPASPELGVGSSSAGTKTANTHTSTVIFTHLAAFKLHGEHAQPHTTITHHLDLADSHGLVLLNGNVMSGRGVSVEEGRWLLMCLQKFYDVEGHGGGVGKERRVELMRKFSSGDKGFSLEELLDEAERVS